MQCSVVPKKIVAKAEIAALLKGHNFTLSQKFPRKSWHYFQSSTKTNVIFQIFLAQFVDWLSAKAELSAVENIKIYYL